MQSIHDVRQLQAQAPSKSHQEFVFPTEYAPSKQNAFAGVELPLVISLGLAHGLASYSSCPHVYYATAHRTVLKLIHCGTPSANY